MLNSLELVRELIAIPGPPGQEEAVRVAVAAHATALGCVHRADERGNLLIAPPGVDTIPEQVDIVVMAHLDEIALMVVRIEPDGRLVVNSLGGLLPWKWGEGPVIILTSPEQEPLTGILSFGSIHTVDRTNPATLAREEALTWDMARIYTGLSAEALTAQDSDGVRRLHRRAVFRRPRRSRGHAARIGNFVEGFLQGILG
jgi:putative aminopeptidase FrvX